MMVFSPKSVVIYFLIVVSVVTTCTHGQDVPDIGYDWRNNVSSRDIVKTIGYWQGQSLVLERIGLDYPELAHESLVLSLELETAFGPAIEAINEYARSKTPDWDEFVTQSRVQLKKQFLNDPLTHDQAVATLSEVKKRLRGQIDSPFRELIMAFHPKYRQNPARELIDEMKVEYSSMGLAKAGKLHLSLDYPASWTSTPGRRPHVVSTFRNDAGHGTASCVILVRKLKPSEVQEWTKQTLRELASRDTLIQEMPTAKFLGDGSTTVGGQFATWTKFQTEQESLGIHSKTMGHIYNIQYDTYYIRLQFFVAVTGHKQEDLPLDKQVEALFRQYDVLFRLMTLSFEIMDRFEEDGGQAAPHLPVSP
jgi:hypothetical protein